jgi:serine/threonine protein phosphatase PrpC
MIRGRVDAPPPAAASVPTYLQSASLSHIGRVRQTNEDRILDYPEHGLFAVADGMGGHSLGDWAATAVIQSLVGISETDISQGAIASNLDAANSRIYALAQERGVTCGSTVAGLAILPTGEGLVFWAGDSRIYRARNNRLARLSSDHSVVQELFDAGVLTATQAKTHPRGNVITRAVGVRPCLEVEFLAIENRPGDVYLLCTDGLSGPVDDDEIDNILQRPLNVALDALIALALERGGKDNISAVLVRL